MSDMEALRHRIEQAELRLKTAHNARQRESAALTSMWEQIRERFAAQSAEILRLRERVSDLEDMRDALQSMLDTLLGSVESSIERMADETVPRITGLAGNLLESVPSPRPAATRIEVPPPRPASTATHVQAAEDAQEDDDDFSAMLTDALDDDVDVPAPPPQERGLESGNAVSPGIRNLISRIERSFDREADPSQQTSAGAASAENGDEDLSRDLDDIRRLRDELQSLRTRIGAGR